MSNGRNLTTSMDTLFPNPGNYICRVCGREYDDGRRSYCSDRCKRVAQAVAKMYNWRPVRKKVLERDEYTCQECGLSKEMAKRAYWQIQERIDERTEYLRDDNIEEWRREQEKLRKRYGAVWTSGMFHVDHIEPVSNGGHPFDETNLRTLCEHCHHEKTAAENSNQPEERPEISLTEYMGDHQ